MAFGSLREAEYQVTIAARLHYMSEEESTSISAKAAETARVLAGLIRSLRDA